MYSDDGRRYMPKLKCPYCNRRFVDVVDSRTKNESSVVKWEKNVDIDFVLECPHCHEKVGLIIATLHFSQICG